MITHVVTFRWREGVGPKDVSALCADLDAFRARVPAILSYRYGADLKLRAGNGDFAIIATVADAEHLASYLDHPAHHELIAKRLGAMVETRLAVQFET